MKTNGVMRAYLYVGIRVSMVHACVCVCAGEAAPCVLNASEYPCNKIVCLLRRWCLERSGIRHNACLTLRVPNQHGELRCGNGMRAIQRLKLIR